MVFDNFSNLIFDWNIIDEATEAKPDKVMICDETLRDGLQNASVRDPTLEEKIEILHLMEKLGIQSLNLGIAGSSTKIANDVLGLAQEIKNSGLKISPNCPARVKKSDVDTYISIANKAGIDIELAIFIASSPIRFLTEGWEFGKILKRVENTIVYAVDNNFPVMFVTEDTTRSSPDHLTKLFTKAIESGAKRLCLCDTTGHATPNGTKNLVLFTKKLIDNLGFQDIEIDWHGHRDRGLSLINAIYALKYGATRIHATAIGIGERSGNIPMEQLLVNLHLIGILKNDISSIMDYTQTIAKYCEISIPKHQPIIGRDAFRTATGIHASAILKAKNLGNTWLADRIYSSVPAEIIGRKQEIEIGPVSGKSNVKYWLDDRKIPYNEKLVMDILNYAKLSQKTLSEQDILEKIKESSNK